MIFQIERDKLNTDEELSKVREERSEMDRSLNNQDQEIQDLRSQVQTLQQGLAETEENHAKK